MDLTTVADDEAVLHDAGVEHRHPGLAPDTPHEIGGHAFRTLPRPGERLATVCTVNDVHYGETECGILDGIEGGPIHSVPPGAEPYPQLMNRCAIAEMQAVGPDAVVVKGDLTSMGSRAEYEQFLEAYVPAFGDRLLHVRGNHDAYHGEDFASEAPLARELPGVLLAVIDTSVPGLASGGLSDDTLDWLDQLAADADRPVLVFGHHHPWDPGSAARPERYFGINPTDSERLVEVVARRPRIWGYFAGHTHRNRVRRFRASGSVPYVEVACVKDFPGAWAEYRVFEGGVLHLVHRIRRADAVAWTERTRGMFGGLYPGYAFGALEERCFV
ncbi:MAG TPA: metallophosphoesterase, partial [Acidimicrobiales bacterium]